MTMQTDVKAAYTNTSAALFAGRTRVKQILAHGTGTAGSIILYDNDTTGSGNVIYQLAFGTSTNPISIDIPGEGILAYNGVYATVVNVTGVTVCYG